MNPLKHIFWTIFVLVGHVNSFRHLSFSSRVTAAVPAMALSPEQFQKIDMFSSLLSKYSAQLSDQDWIDNQGDGEVKEIREKVKHYQTLLRSVKVMQDIEKDIELCKIQLDNPDVSVKEKAKTFYGEFCELREGLEEQVTKLLANKYMVDAADNISDDWDELNQQALFAPDANN